MRKSLLTLLLILILCIHGCDFDKEIADVSEDQIKTLTVEYNLENGTHRRVRIDFENGEKTVKDYFPDGEKEKAFKLIGQDKISFFLAEIVIPEINGSRESYEGDAEKIVWVVSIDIGSKCIIDEGIGQSSYPDYWDELLEIIGE